MIKLRIPQEEISVMMQRDYLDSLTVIAHERIDPHGIDFVVNKFKMKLDNKDIEYSEMKWDEFWSYFRKTWLEIFPPHLRNINGIQRAVVNHTSGPLERYDLELNWAFPTTNPNIPTFVGVIQNHASRYVTLLEDIARKRARAPPHGTYVVSQEVTM
ncbi:hypothetical protein PF004_g532 [Phytophthora fragariae]|uniref:Uncharacterized protein n=2 Tax=Phytophthora fragariae TaxID=53985 RepID=A0A6G0PVH5_9STRA|nr:hypothetical protein PF004_g532 [Phytophthora fragariae]